MGAARFLFIFSLWGLIAMRILPAAATDTPPETEVWLTLADQSHLLSPEARLRFSAGMPPDDMHYVIRVDDSTQYQRMEGFGAAMTDSSAWLLMRLLSDRQRAEVMQNLFTREGTGIGISYVRIPIGASDFALYDYSYNDLPRGETDPQLTQFSINYDEAYIIPALQMAQRLNPQLRFMASPWSAPAWMKSGGQFHGGELLPQYYQAFADYLVRFVQAYAEHGITIDTLTPQNEPMHESPNYPTMRMSAEAQAAFIRDYLGPALQRAGLSTRLVIFDHNWDLYQYALTVLADPAAAAFVSGVGFHCYGGSVANQSIVRDAHPNVGIWFTECSGGDWSPQFAGNLSWNLHHLGIGNFRNWGNSLLLWNLALDENSGPQNGGCGDCRGVVTINQATAAVSYNVEYYVLGHFSRLIDPGAYRIASTSFIDGQPENVAFLNPDGSLVLVVHSTQDTAFAVEWRGQHFTYTLPAGAVVSFRWSGTTEDN
ncbi:MAG: glycosyl hydrolase [Chloroflexi bacterium]|nr:glycosyl hydrolase [Chloroflexota bacterium]